MSTQPHQLLRPTPPPGLPLACRACGLWADGCRHALMRGVGPEPADLLVVGGSPGYQEDMYGEPWTANVGEYVRRRLAAHGIGGSVFFTNAMKCKLPPTPRWEKRQGPTPDQLAHCRTFFDVEFARVRPKVVLAVGDVATKQLLRMGDMGAARSQVWRYNNAYCVASWEPKGGFGDTFFGVAFEKDLRRVVRGLKGELERPQTTDYRECRTADQVRAALKDLARAPFITLDLETSPMKPWTGPNPRILSFQMSGQARTAYVFPWAHPDAMPAVSEQAAIWELLTNFISDPRHKFVLQNGIFDATWLYWFGCRIGRIWGDCMQGHYLLDETAPSHALAGMVWDYTDMGDYWAPMERWIEQQEGDDRRKARDTIQELKKAVKDEELSPEDAEVLIEEQQDKIDLGFTYDRIPWAGPAGLGRYSAMDSDAEWRIWEQQEEQLKAEGLLGLMTDLYGPMILAFARMQCSGVKYDEARRYQIQQVLENLEREAMAKIRTLPNVKEYEAELRKRAESVKAKREAGEKGLKLQKPDEEGYFFNPSSPAQLGDFLYRFLQIPVPRVPGKRKKGQQDTTSIEALTMIEGKSASVRHIKKLRKVTKYCSTYIAPVPSWRGTDDFVHTQFFPTGTDTGRPSSRAPNLLNIPREGDEAAEEYGIPGVKTTWVSRFDGGFIAEGDLSQIEVRVAANYSDDGDLIRVFSEGGDVHRATAARVWGLPLNEVSDNQRQIAKKAVFAMQYGAQAAKIAQIIGCTEEEAQQFLNGYFKQFPGVKRFMDQQARLVCEAGEVRTLTGQKRRLVSAIGKYNQQNDHIVSSCIRKAVNSPIQGTAAHICITAVNTLDQLFWKYRLKSLLISSVYDSIIIDMHPDETALLTTVVPRVMTSLKWPWLKIPLVSDFKVGRSWGTASEFTLNNGLWSYKVSGAVLETTETIDLPVPARLVSVKVARRGHDGKDLGSTEFSALKTHDGGRAVRLPALLSKYDIARVTWAKEAA